MKIFIGTCIFLLLSLIGYAIATYTSFHDGRLHVIACNVGQGDAALIRTPTGKYLLLDGGPDEKVLTCLERHMPLWQRTLSLILLSHPHYDHFTGLISVAERYHALRFTTEKLGNPAAAFQEFQKVLREKGLSPTYAYAGDQFDLGDNIVLHVLSPTHSALELISPTGNITDSKEFTNIVQLLSYGKISFLFTGDSQAMLLNDALKTLPKEETIVLQVPHHGSRFGLTQQIVRQIHPVVSYISVGKNTYGHPAPSTIELLQDSNVPFFRTDRNGDIEFITDGKTLTYTTTH